jgi:monofunctional biosynthetic peptidoglycan transglycosylase
MDEPEEIDEPEVIKETGEADSTVVVKNWRDYGRNALVNLKKNWRCYAKKGLAVLKWTAVFFFASTLFVEVLFTFINPPVTPLMISRVVEQKINGKRAKLHKKWMPIEKISPNMYQAVVASEDNRFLEHWGIDVQAIEKAVQYNKRHRRKHGASTITQQVAKNVFLWPARTWLRKGFELYFTVTIDLIWSKRRIMEVYLNVIETGDGIYGTEAAAKDYFHKSAKNLTRGEAALIAACLPNPRKRNPAAPTPYLLRRQGRILNLMNKIGNVKF